MAGKVVIVIPVHNGKAELFRCLDSVTKVEYPGFRCTVVDDGSTDGVATELAELYPWVRVLHGDGSLWWTGATNLGVQDAITQGSADYILTLNHDTVVAPDFLDQLIACSERFPGAIVGSKILFLEDPSKIWAAGGGAKWSKGGLHHFGFGERDGGVHEREREVLWFPGMGVLIPVSVFGTVGIYDQENFPQYYGDAEFCFRARRAGISIVICPQSRLWNEVGNSGLNKQQVDLRFVWQSLWNRRSSRNVKDTFRFYSRHCPLPYLPLCLGSIYFNHFRSLGRRWISRMKDGR